MITLPLLPGVRDPSKLSFFILFGFPLGTMHNNIELPLSVRLATMPSLNEISRLLKLL